METETLKGVRLSPQQRRVWLLQQEGSVYNAACALWLEGELRVEWLREALRGVAARHQILRTSFRRRPGSRLPIQVVAEEGRVAWQEFDWSDRDAPRQRAGVADQFRAQLAEPFGLEDESAFGATLIKCSPREHALILRLPALCADERTLDNLAREVADAYGAARGGAEPADDPVQYAQFAKWQNAMIEDEDGAAGRDYWQKRLAPDPEPPLPFERRSAAGTAFRPASLSTAVDPQVAAGLAGIAGRQETSTEALLLTCWGALLWRHTGEPGLVVRAGFDGRGYEELETACGLFARHIPVPSRMKDGLPFVAALAETAELLAEAAEWQEFYSWEQEAGAQESPAPPSARAFGFDYRRRPAEISADGLVVRTWAQAAYGERFKLRLSCVGQGDELLAEFHYDESLFDAGDVGRLAERFHELLSGVAREPGAHINLLNMLGEAERRELLHDFNRTAADYPRDTRVHRLFEAQARRTPQRIAVAHEGDELTYAELNARANRLARHLRRQGVGPETTVGLLTERSTDALVALLGILKAGGAYVPLDPSYPRERVAGMLRRGVVKLLLTQQHLADELRPPGVPVLALDAEWPRIAEQGAEDLPDLTAAENLAYVIHTSGSTGHPKGVCVEHRQLLNYLHGVSERLQLDEGAGFATVTTLAADLGYTAVFPSLCGGGTLHILSQERASDADALAAYFEAHPVDCLKIVPSHLAALLNTATHPELVLPRRRLVVGGEASHWDLVEKVAEYAPDCRVLNHYGPTETTVGVLTYEAGEAGDRRGATVPLGKPLGNSQVYVLDADMRPAPVGMIGEIYIGGAGVARGYLQQPALTAERFVPDPFNAGPGARLYRTGDLGRHLAVGAVEFLGRADDQVKVRGYRIELGEIEAALAEHPSVREAAVVARDDEQQQKSLVAYVVAREDGDGGGATPQSSQDVDDLSLTSGALRAYLLRTLPEYMLPSGFVLLDRLPRTPNGKVDRRALPAPEHTRAELAGAFVAPRTPTEEIVAGIWAQVLRAERVGVNDNFFELGGHSLLATQVVSRIRQVFQVEVGLRSLFNDATVAGLSRAVELAQAAGRGIEAPPLRPVARDGELPLSFAQQRLWFIAQMEPDSPLYNIPVALRLGGPLDVTVLGRTLSEVIRRHEILRTSFPTVGEEPVQRIAPFEPLTLEVEDLREASEGEREAEALRRVREEAGRPFDLARGPLVRVRLLRLAEDDHVVMLTMHHIVSDGWSGGLLVNEVVALYAAFTRGEESPLAELPVQYADHAAWQRSWLTGDVLESHLKYWREQLGGAAAVLELPTDFARPAAPRHRGRIHSTSIPAEVAEGLRGLSRREGATLFMVLLAGWQALLSRYTGQEDIAVGAPVAGRSHAEAENLIGFFVNTLVLRTDLSGDPTFRELLGRVREVALGAYAHQDVPFERLVEELTPERDMSRSPLFQVAFVLQNAPLGDLELPGLTLRNVGADNETAKFELTLSLAETTEGLGASLQYDTDLFEQTTAERILSHFAMLLREVAADPRRRLSELSVMSEEERRRVLHEWNETATPFPAHVCVHELFERQAADTPDAVAVSYGDERLTYAELDERANRLGRYLRAAGVGPDVPVGLSVKRSPLMVVGMLGVLKAGGAYLPLDPSYPMERLTFMLEDARVGVLLTQQSILDRLPEAARGALLDAMHVLCLDSQWEQVARHEADGFEAGAGAENLAYIIYTSGSTGTPKGVAVPHRAVTRLVRDTDYVSLRPDDRVAQASNASFDAATFEVWGALLNGARLVGVPHETLLSPPELGEHLGREGVTTMFLTTALFNQVAQHRPAAFSGLRHLLFGGQAVDPRRAADLLASGYGGRLLHVYGPTEATTFSTWQLVGGVGEGDRTVPIGRPLSNGRTYVLGGRGEVAPVGAAGELYLGGAGLARGYLRRPGLTAERFVPDAYSGEAGARLYRTGDVGRQRAGGEVEFIGRVDKQVKIRGFRVEPGEVEAALAAHPGVGEAAVVARAGEGEEGARLVAYAAVGEGGPAAAELRAYLRGRLPEYMVPSRVVTVERLPLTANGKVDYGALPRGEAEREAGGREYVAPRTGTEELLANIWGDVLGVEKVGVEDDFFDLGGHSLMATRVTSRIRQAFNVEMPLRALFETPTISGLAESLEELVNSEREGMGQITDVLEMLDGLSEEEVNAMLEERAGRAEAPGDSLTETPYG